MDSSPPPPKLGCCCGKAVHYPGIHPSLWEGVSKAHAHFPPQNLLPGFIVCSLPEGSREPSRGAGRCVREASEAKKGSSREFYKSAEMFCARS